MLVCISLVNYPVVPTSVWCNDGSLSVFVALTYICTYLRRYILSYMAACNISCHYGIPNCIRVCMYIRITVLICVSEM